MTYELIVKDIMTPNPCIIRPTDRVSRALHEMQLGDFRHLPVIDEHGRLVGIVSHRDLVVADGNVAVARNMCADVETVRPETAAHEAALLMLRDKIGCVPVVDDGGAVVGIVTATDFLSVAYTALGGLVSVEQIELEAREDERV